MMPVPTLENPKGQGPAEENHCRMETERRFAQLRGGGRLVRRTGVEHEASASKRSAGDWDESVAVFLEGYAQMIQEIRKNAGEGLREIVVVAPSSPGKPRRPLPDHRESNRRMQVRDALQGFAKENKARFVDLFGDMGGDKFEGKVSADGLTHDGLHFTQPGYRIGRSACSWLGDDFSASGPLADKLRESIIEKNRLFFHRWRPANETYLSFSANTSRETTPGDSPVRPDHRRKGA